MKRLFFATKQQKKTRQFCRAFFCGIFNVKSPVNPEAMQGVSYEDIKQESTIEKLIESLIRRAWL